MASCFTNRLPFDLSTEGTAYRNKPQFIFHSTICRCLGWDPNPNSEPIFDKFTAVRHASFDERMEGGEGGGRSMKTGKEPVHRD